MAPSVLGETSPSLLRNNDQQQNKTERKKCEGNKKRKRKRRRGKLPLSKSSDKLSLAGELVAVHVALDIPTGKALVVAGDESVGVVHARSVHGKPVDHADGVTTVVLDAQHRHVLVDVVRVLIGLWVVRVRVRRAAAHSFIHSSIHSSQIRSNTKSVSDKERRRRKVWKVGDGLGVGVEEGSVVDLDVSGLETLVCKHDGGSDTVDDGVKVLLDETKRGHVVKSFSRFLETTSNVPFGQKRMQKKEKEKDGGGEEEEEGGERKRHCSQ
jgi:hypothetical protein